MHVHQLTSDGLLKGVKFTSANALDCALSVTFRDIGKSCASLLLDDLILKGIRNWDRTISTQHINRPLLNSCIDLVDHVMAGVLPPVAAGLRHNMRNLHLALDEIGSFLSPTSQHCKFQSTNSMGRSHQNIDIHAAAQMPSVMTMHRPDTRVVREELEHEV